MSRNFAAHARLARAARNARHAAGRGAAACLLALLAGVGGAAQAATMPLVNLSGWLHGDVSNVSNSMYGGAAGAFVGTLSGAGEFDSSSFVTFCLEIEQSMSFNTTMQYSVVNGATYFLDRRGDPTIADRLAQLAEYAVSHPAEIDTKEKSASLQLAVWNLVYDRDWSLTDPTGNFSDWSNNRWQADTLLAGARNTTGSTFEIYVLKGDTTQDFVLLKARTGASAPVDEPPNWALVLLAMLGMAAARIRPGVARRADMSRR